ncbi:MAG: A/G-specific adenine glycosylase [Acidimicrobiales bacterium]
MDLQGALLAWSAAGRRDLPWRHTRDPWAVVVSEVMLQQTQVARVVPRYAAFLEQFPTPAACAAAPPADVVRSWAGLGYNHRAVSLRRLATAVVERHDGRLPGDLASLLALPGVGPYTARAVLAFAFEADVGVVDVNAARVLARTAGHPLRAADVQARADALVPQGCGWVWNQAMLDLGATVCTKRAPRCGDCPVAAWCAWRTAAGVAGEPHRADPAVGSAGTGGRQSAFAGSDRQGRGRLVDALRLGPVAWDAVAAAAGWPGDDERARRVAATLVADGLADDDGASLRLPGAPPGGPPASSPTGTCRAAR